MGIFTWNPSAPPRPLYPERTSRFTATLFKMIRWLLSHTQNISQYVTFLISITKRDITDLIFTKYSLCVIRNCMLQLHYILELFWHARHALYHCHQNCHVNCKHVWPFPEHLNYWNRSLANCQISIWLVWNTELNFLKTIFDTDGHTL